MRFVFRDHPGLVRYWIVPVILMLLAVVGLGWAIADFQPEPQPDCAFDPTLRIPAGLRLVIPSVNTVLERVFNESRRAAHEA
jgi:hypothetical protein